ncbi:hypothetical protein AB0F24_38590 [Streptomyces platensis]|uniref:hypothetical protein n=1 Tax=Streptomyces platensis TaxID=58346 RepID=UPI00340072A0
MRLHRLDQEVPGHAVEELGDVELHNFESYEKNKIERLGADAARPHRATYKKLTRD